jgi:hypothetical protein
VIATIDAPPLEVFIPDVDQSTLRNPARSLSPREATPRLTTPGCGGLAVPADGDGDDSIDGDVDNDTGGDSHVMDVTSTLNLTSHPGSGPETDMPASPDVSRASLDVSNPHVTIRRLLKMIDVLQEERHLAERGPSRGARVYACKGYMSLVFSPLVATSLQTWRTFNAKCRSSGSRTGTCSSSSRRTSSCVSAWRQEDPRRRHAQACRSVPDGWSSLLPAGS